MKAWRYRHHKTMLELATTTGIDQALISKYENGKRAPSPKHLDLLSQVMDDIQPGLQQIVLANKIARMLQFESNPKEILEVAETRLEYLLHESGAGLAIPALSKDLTQKLEAIDTLKLKWQAAKPLSAIQLQKMKEYFNIEYTYNSNKIEGNTLTLQETHLVVNEGLTISGKSMTEHLEAVNHAEATDWLYELVGDRHIMAKRNLLNLHYLVLKSIDGQNAGNYRTVPVRISGSTHVPPQPFLLANLMQQYFSRLDQISGKVHPVILAAEAHERLVSIHPFIDGNGRTARLFMNLILLHHGYTLTVLKGEAEHRMAYYRALEDAQVNNNPEAFYSLIADRVEDSLNQHLSMLA